MDAPLSSTVCPLVQVPEMVTLEVLEKCGWVGVVTVGDVGRLLSRIQVNAIGFDGCELVAFCRREKLRVPVAWGAMVNWKVEPMQRVFRFKAPER